MVISGRAVKCARRGRRGWRGRPRGGGAGAGGANPTDLSREGSGRRRCGRRRCRKGRSTRSAAWRLGAVHVVGRRACNGCGLSQKGAGTCGAVRAFSAPSGSALRRERARGARRCGAALERRVRGSGEGGDPGEGRWYL